MYHMKALYTFLLLIVIGCSSNYELTTFEHPLLKIEYPANWVTIDEPGVILTVAKYDRELWTIKEENPNIVIVANDSLNFADEDVTSFEEFLTEFKRRTLLLENRTLIEDLKELEINGNKIYRISYKVDGELKTLTQEQYFFSKDGMYVTVMGTYNFGGTGKEINSIINSLELPIYEPIGKLLDLTDSI